MSTTQTRPSPTWPEWQAVVMAARMGSTMEASASTQTMILSEKSVNSSFTLRLSMAAGP